MSNVLGENIRRLRKEAHLTQEALALKLHVTAQAVSRWECGDGAPDLSLLVALSDVFGVNLDLLVGHVSEMTDRTYFSKAYTKEEYYWGTEPSPLCYEILKRYPPSSHPTLLEIGCGEGRDAVFFARNGYRVTAFDIARSGIDKAYRLADRFHVPLMAFRADLLHYRAEEQYDIIYSSRTLQYIPPERRPELIAHYQEQTAPDGVNAFDVFVDKPFTPAAPDAEEPTWLWKTGELLSFYGDWYIDFIAEETYDCNSSDVPHRHTSDRMFARKPIPETR